MDDESQLLNRSQLADEAAVEQAVVALEEAESAASLLPGSSVPGATC